LGAAGAGAAAAAALPLASRGAMAAARREGTRALCLGKRQERPEAGGLRLKRPRDSQCPSSRRIVARSRRGKKMRGRPKDGMNLLSRFPLEVVSVPGAGRGVCVTRDCAAGELLLSARPYAVALDGPWVDTVCLGCAKTARHAFTLRCEVRWGVMQRGAGGGGRGAGRGGRGGRARLRFATTLKRGACRWDEHAWCADAARPRCAPSCAALAAAARPAGVQGRLLLLRRVRGGRGAAAAPHGVRVGSARACVAARGGRHRAGAAPA
jgi:hypothetical protein